MPNVDLNIQQEINGKSQQIPVWHVVQNYFEINFQGLVILYTDGSKDPQSGLAGAAVYIPRFDHYIKKRVTNHISVYSNAE